MHPFKYIFINPNLGGAPEFHPIKGFASVIPPHNLQVVTQCLLNVLCEIPKTNPQALPKVITISTIGVTRSSRSQVPFLLNIFYGYLITGSQPLQDKLGTERVIYHCAVHPQALVYFAIARVVKVVKNRFVLVTMSNMLV